MHIHQVHFLAYAETTAERRPAVAGHRECSFGGSVDVIMDFTDPVIKGMSVFHAIFSITKTKG